MSKTTAIISWKGGVGKTTSAVNISSYIKMQNKRVCVVDLDPQHSMSKHLGIFPGHLKNIPTMYDLLNAAIDEASDAELNELVHESIIKTTTVDLIPATAKLSALDKVLPTATCREQLLKNILKFIRNEYDYIFIDCHPGGDLFAINALTAADTVIVPVEAHIMSSDGLEQVEKMIRTVQRHLNPDLQIEGIIITKFQQNTNCCKRIRDMVLENFGERIHIFDDNIKYSIKVAEAPEFGISIHEYAPHNDTAKAYANIALEVMQ